MLVPVRASPVPSVLRNGKILLALPYKMNSGPRDAAWVKFFDANSDAANSAAISAGRSRSSASERCSGPALASLALQINPITITQSHADPKGPCAAQAARACEWHSLCTYVLDHLRPSHAVAAAVSRPIWGQTPLVAASPAPPVNVTRP